MTDSKPKASPPMTPPDLDPDALEIERLRALAYRTLPGTHPLLPAGQLWRDEFDKACEQWKIEAMLACDLRVSQDTVISRCAKAIENDWPDAAKRLREHVDGISGEDWGALTRALERIVEAWGNRGETTSLHTWNERMKAAIDEARATVTAQPARAVPVQGAR